jgi:hypothetical protein
VAIGAGRGGGIAGSRGEEEASGGGVDAQLDSYSSSIANIAV